MVAAELEQVFAQHAPRFALLVRIVMVQVMPSYLGATQHMVLAAVNDFNADAQPLHHGRAGAAQVVRSPWPRQASGQDERIVVHAAFSWAGPGRHPDCLNWLWRSLICLVKDFTSICD